MRGDRGVTPVVGVILMVSVTVLVAAMAGAFALGFADGKQREPAPQVSTSSDGFSVSGGYDQVVSITHRGGDPVTVSNLEIQVSFSEHSEQSRLHGVPTTDIDPDDYEGDDIWDGGATGVRDALASDETAGSDDEWSSGESITFRLASGDVDVNPGETVTVTVVHEPSGEILLESEFVAQPTLESVNEQETMAAEITTALEPTPSAHEPTPSALEPTPSAHEPTPSMLDSNSTPWTRSSSIVRVRYRATR